MITINLDYYLFKLCVGNLHLSTAYLIRSFITGELSVNLLLENLSVKLHTYS